MFSTRILVSSFSIRYHCCTHPTNKQTIRQTKSSLYLQYQYSTLQKYYSILSWSEHKIMLLRQSSNRFNIVIIIIVFWYIMLHDQWNLFSSIWYIVVLRSMECSMNSGSNYTKYSEKSSVKNDDYKDWWYMTWWMDNGDGIM